jgi:hypothetical protein
MYPHTFMSLFPPFPTSNRVFVAMSFHERFASRWNDVIAPAIHRVEIDGVPLEPYRVDARRISDSILTEILGGISNARLVFADVTSVTEAPDPPVRNGNVMYEVGIAHATRLAEEVLLFRSDRQALLFDVANVRVNEYDPDHEPAMAVDKIQETILDALREIQLQRHRAIGRALASLDYPCLKILIESPAGIAHPKIDTMRDALSKRAVESAISRLLDIGILSSEPIVFNPQMNLDAPLNEGLLTYRLTKFGEAVLRAYAEAAGMFAPSMARLIEKAIESETPHPR